MTLKEEIPADPFVLLVPANDAYQTTPPSGTLYLAGFVCPSGQSRGAMACETSIATDTKSGAGQESENRA